MKLMVLVNNNNQNNNKLLLLLFCCICSLNIYFRSRKCLDEPSLEILEHDALACCLFTGDQIEQSPPPPFQIQMLNEFL